ncbi:hypothetical protein [Luethyella okanaganae]|uniref:Uncharacterized protein n=1 Tax=Luethyella okanaganae TaxID=69372 RepID=A0ABW1VIN9_9MICO
MTAWTDPIAPSGPPVPVEPTSSLPLRWGGYRGRWWTGLVCVALGIASVQLTSTFSLGFLLAGTALQAVGWLALPAAGWRRALVLLPCLFTSWLVIGGAGFAVFYAVFAASWLLVRHRPLLSWIALALPIATGLLLRVSPHEYRWNMISFTLGAAAVVSSAWLARAISRHFPGKTR